tara:strand:+ start:23382 stop:26099 length:2718 start_codon:yes stop_codon:yes gene_type:complete
MPTSVSLIERLRHYAQTAPHQDAVITPTITLSYLQLAWLVQLQAEILSKEGVDSSSSVGIECADNIGHLVLCLASVYLGATSCTIPTYETDHVRNAIADQCRATHILGESVVVNPATVNCNSGDIPLENRASEAQLLFSTSGTTGTSKLVIHHDSDIVMQAHRHVGSNEERFACLASIEHNFAKRHRLYCLAVGATNVFPREGMEFLVTQCQSLGVNVLHLSIFQAQELLAAPDMDALEGVRLKLGGSHAPLPFRQQLRSNITNNLQAGYGTTETGAIAFTAPDDTEAGESVGQPLPGIHVRVVTPERETLQVGEHGEIAIKCDGMFRGYFERQELTAARLEDGWFYTGDIGYLDEQQRIYLCGRSDDMFVFNSMNIYPQEIESVICQCPGVADAAVIAKESSVHGKIPVALVVFSKSETPNIASLKKFTEARIGVRSPRQFILVEEIPRNDSGKVSRQNAKEVYEKTGDIKDTIFKALEPKIKKAFRRSKIAEFQRDAADLPIEKLALDSLDRMDLLVSLEVHYEIVITPVEFYRCGTVKRLISLVLSHVESEEKDEAGSAPVSEIAPYPSHENTAPYTIRFFWRFFRLCKTASQLLQTLKTLEHRLTPMEVELLNEWHSRGQLVPSLIPKYSQVTSDWLNNIKGKMLLSGKQLPEPFVLTRLRPTLRYFTGLGPRSDKSLIICFAERGQHIVSMPHAVLLQHTDASRFDLLIVSETLSVNYDSGVPFLGKGISQLSRSLGGLEFIGDYQTIRTLGSSAGAYPALVTGYLLNAQVSVGVNGRFSKVKNHPIRVLKRIFAVWSAGRKGSCDRVLLSYCEGEERDQKYAEIMASLLSDVALLVVNFENEKPTHHILPMLLERGELRAFLEQTIYAAADDDHLVDTKPSSALNAGSTITLVTPAENH